MKLLISFLALTLLCSAAAPVITPSAPPVVYCGTTYTFMADQAVTWTLRSGSAGSIDPATGIYTAPACGTFAANNNYVGVMAFPNDSIFNTKIDNVPVDATLTAYWIAQVGGVQLQFDTSFQPSVYHNTTPTTAMSFFYTPGNNGNFPFLPFPYLGVEGGVFNDIYSSSADAHITGANPTTQQFVEVYNTRSPDPGCSNCNAASGVKYQGNAYTLLTGGTDSAGLPLIPLALRYSELRSCIDNGTPIKHALRITLDQATLAAAFVWPAQAFATTSGLIPNGQRARLKSTFDQSSFSTGAQCILTTMKQYGLLIADAGSDGHMTSMADAIADFDLLGVLNELPNGTGHSLTTSQIELLNESTLQDTTVGSPTYHSYRVDPANAYQTPANTITVIATNGAVQASTMPVILQAVTVGTDYANGYNVMAGTPAIIIPVYVNGASDLSYACSGISVGSVTAVAGGCQYTAPATSSTRQKLAITVTPTADSSQAITISVYLYPQGGIRQRFQNVINTDYGPDANGNTWFAEAGTYYRGGGLFCAWASSPWPGVADIQRYYNCDYGPTVNDQLFRAFVSNGTYALKLFYGVGSPNPFIANTWISSIDTQGTVYGGSGAVAVTGNGAFAFKGITGGVFDLCNVIAACAGAVPGSISITVVVTDNVLVWATRNTWNGSANIGRTPNAFSIEPLAATNANTPKFPSVGRTPTINRR